MAFCTQCGKEIKDGTAFCTYCGAKQQPAEAGTQKEMLRKEEKPRRVKTVRKTKAKAVKASGSGKVSKRFFASVGGKIIIAFLSLALVAGSAYGLAQLLREVLPNLSVADNSSRSEAGSHSAAETISRPDDISLAAAETTSRPDDISRAVAENTSLPDQTKEPSSAPASSETVPSAESEPVTESHTLPESTENTAEETTVEATPETTEAPTLPITPETTTEEEATTEEETVPETEEPDENAWLLTLQVGDSFVFGKYEQDGNTGNGPEEIEWIVFARNEKQIWAISRYILEMSTFNRVLKDTTYVESDIRKWLNSDFIAAAFSEEEQARLAYMSVETEANPVHSGAKLGPEVEDLVALLSVQEIEEYLTDLNERQCRGTAYALARGLSEAENGYSPWWTRTPGAKSSQAVIARSAGDFNLDGRDVNVEVFGVRPVISFKTGQE